MTLAYRNTGKAAATTDFTSSQCVALVCDPELSRRPIAATLERAGIALEARTRSAKNPLDGRRKRPSALIYASSKLDREAIEAIQALRAEDPDLPLLVVAPSPSPKAVREAVTAGADGIVGFERVEAALVAAIRAVWAGQITLPREWREQINLPALSAREKQVLGMVVMGFSNSEIAAKLFLAESTVKSHLSSAFNRLGVRSRAEATALILDPERGLGTGILTISS